jgi:hypothetical protein
MGGGLHRSYVPLSDWSCKRRGRSLRRTWAMKRWLPRSWSWQFSKPRDIPPNCPQSEVRAILARAYHNEVRRRRRAGNKFSFRGTATEVEILSPFTDLSFTAVEAELDLDKMLRETPADLRAGMLLRYGARRRWSEVAQEVAQPKEAVRKRCEREMERIRKRLGFEKGPHRDRPH